VILGGLSPLSALGRVVGLGRVGDRQGPRAKGLGAGRGLVGRDALPLWDAGARAMRP
jgi:hypothetical protein